MRLIIISGMAILWLTGGDWAHATPSRIHALELKAYDRTQYPYLKYTRTTSKKDTGHAKEVSFESLRMLSTGMTKAEVVSRVGSPRHSFKKSRVWVYSATDNWIVQLTFAGERVIGINWTRP